MRYPVILVPLLLMTGCISSPPIISTAGDCTELLPSEWLEGVESAPYPDEQTVGAALKFGDAQTGQLDKANDHYSAAIGICHRFNQRNAAAVKRSRPKFLGLF